ncbi:hypothetical protein D3C77_760700 [compost metagenome]
MFIRGVLRAHERKQKAKTRITIALDKPETITSAVVFDEQYRVDLVNKIITHIRKK